MCWPQVTEIFIWDSSKKFLKNYLTKNIPDSFVHLQYFKTLCLKNLSTKDIKGPWQFLMKIDGVVMILTHRTQDVDEIRVPWLYITDFFKLAKCVWIIFQATAFEIYSAIHKILPIISFRQLISHNQGWFKHILERDLFYNKAIFCSFVYLANIWPWPLICFTKKILVLFKSFLGIFAR